MKKELILPFVSCDNCNGDLYLVINTKRVKIESLKAVCRECEYSIDLIEKTHDKITEGEEKAKEITKRLTNKLIELKDTIPKDKDQLKEVVTNPKHPFTAALLTGLLLIIMEFSGFGVFMLITWILGNLILNPVGWVLIPVIVAIVIKHRNIFKKSKIEDIKRKLLELEEKLNSGKITKEQYEIEKEIILTEAF